MNLGKSHIVFVFCMLTSCLSSPSERRILDELEKNSLSSDLEINDIFLGIAFGDSKTLFDQKLDSLYALNLIKRIIPDSLRNETFKLEEYNLFYYQFDEKGLGNLKWLFKPEFHHNRLHILKIVNSPVINHFLDGEQDLDFGRGLLKSLLDESREVLEDAEITYRMMREYLSKEYGMADFENKQKTNVYWLNGNLEVALRNNSTSIEIEFKDLRICE
ncbi:hypothetical protein QQ008_18275 [Fulvivirgaceae bacterium BMA10]|uniref:Lipoprotein n=1 Tax=Splendidivirga corallicola TaxID=3051826 RepID=A0ABT8KSZ7_9BACT|nr:hypothetical protein [Fulvivirgaceae bacterium BMA10]